MSAPPPADPDPGENGSQSSRATRVRVPTTVLVLVALTLVALVALGLRLAPDAGGAALRPVAPTTTSPSPASRMDPSRSSTAGRSVVGRAAKPKPVRTDAQRAAGLRADGSAAKVPARGSGEFTSAHVSRTTSATRGRLVRFDVRVEHGLAADADQAALLIARVLDDDRSWRGLGVGRFTLVPVGAGADVHAYLATPGTTDQLCAPLLTRGNVSCQNGPRVVLNANRWVKGVAAYGDDTAGYRRYLVNHEFGHAIGRQHVGCPGRGRRAPVMMQQTKGLNGCRPNSWPTRTRG